MSKMIINVEFLAGTDITDAISEARHKAMSWDVAYVCFKFNGIDFSIGRNVDVYSVVEEYHSSARGKHNSICAA